MSHIDHYNSAGEKIPSVSAISSMFAEDISGFEDYICKGLHEKESKCCIKAKREFYTESANLGHDIHALREAFLKGEAFKDGVPEYQAAVFDPIATFYKESLYKPLYIETVMTGKTFGGTLDGAGTFSVPFWNEQRKTFWANEARNLDGSIEGPPQAEQTVWIEDLKIKSKLSKTHPLQLYGYSVLLKELYGIEAKWGLIIRREKKLNKKPEIQLKGYYLPAYSDLWDAAMKIWRFLNA